MQISNRRNEESKKNMVDKWKSQNITTKEKKLTK